MAESVQSVFDEFAAAWNRGEAPDPRKFLDRVEDPNTLAEMIDRFLISASPPQPQPEVTAAVEAWLAGEPTLATIRAKKGRRVDEVVGAILQRCGLAAERAGKVGEYYQRLEQGLLRPGRVAPSVFEAIGAALEIRPGELPVWPGAPAAGEPVLRERPDAAEILASAPAPAAELASLAADPPDEVDQLFGVTG